VGQEWERIGLAATLPAIMRRLAQDAETFITRVLPALRRAQIEPALWDGCSIRLDAEAGRRID
jgi:hypothetical protein